MDFFHIVSFLPFLFSTASGQFNAPAVELNRQPLNGIYLTSATIVSERGRNIVDEFARLGGNMIVFDIQSGGKLAYPSNLPLSVELDNRANLIPDLSVLIRQLHDKGFYVVTRFVLFKNGFLASKKPRWVLKRRGTQSVFVNRDGPVWLDPGNPELRDYLTEVSRELILNGADEVQFDYVRFPEAGKGGYIGYSYTGENNFSRVQTITDFVAQAASEIHALGAKVSVDMFGIVVWDNVSGRIIGQNVPELAQHVDAIYPMPYPSHFGPGWGGHRNPADEPYFFVQETTKKFLEQASGTQAAIRPWLQGFAMRVSRFSQDYIREQIRALFDIGVNQFAVWNAANNYTVTFQGLR